MGMFAQGLPRDGLAKSVGNSASSYLAYCQSDWSNQCSRFLIRLYSQPSYVKCNRINSCLASWSQIRVTRNKTSDPSIAARCLVTSYYPKPNNAEHNRWLCGRGEGGWCCWHNGTHGDTFLPIADDELEVEVEVEAVLEVVGWAVWSGMDAPFWEAAVATTSMT